MTEQPCSNCGTRHEAGGPCACKVCGSNRIRERHAMIRCENCARFVIAPTREETLADWNRRIVTRGDVDCCTACGRPAGCTWMEPYDREGVPYSATSCGRAFVMEGTPHENGYEYCPGCGGRIMFVAAQGDDEDDEKGGTEE